MTPNDLIPTPRWLLGQLLQVITAPTTSLTLNFAGHQQLGQIIATATNRYPDLDAWISVDTADDSLSSARAVASSGSSQPVPNETAGWALGPLPGGRRHGEPGCVLLGAHVMIATTSTGLPDMCRRRASFGKLRVPTRSIRRFQP